jgi:formamidopyrimidine-DNA glycosylase
VPELPEVEVVRAGLEPAVTGAQITAVEVFDSRSLRRHSPVGGEFAQLLEGSRMLSAVRRGKFLWFPLERQDARGLSAAEGQAAQNPAQAQKALVTHLGMSGQVLLREPGAEESGLLRIRLHIEHPRHGEFWVNFVDQRIFGSMAVDSLVPTPDGQPAGLGSALAAIPTQVAHIARDPLDPAFSDADFFAALARKNSGIKRVLLDQTLISGIGNIYADEALWAARIHYLQPTNSLSRPRAKLLLAEVRLVLEKALAEGGTSFDAQYVNVNGASGYFSHSLNAYGQQGKPCPRCGRPIERESFMNRGSHFCARCQRMR